MGANSGIQWTDHTFNPWIGCTKISAGCTNCYAESLDKRMGGAVDKRTIDERKVLRWGPNGLRTRTAPANWAKPIAWDKAAKAARRRDKVFCASLADVFEDNERFPLHEWRADLFRLIRTTPNLDWLLLTKRPENVVPMLITSMAISSDPDTGDWLQNWAYGYGRNVHAGRPENVWLGCTVENQEQADLRLPHLLATPATVRFISCEPLIGPVHLGLREMANGCGPRPIKTTGIDWVIVGGESGAAEKVRPFHVNWARDILTECYSSGVAPFMKQLGRLPVVIDRDGVDRTLTLPDTHGGEWGEWPANLDDLRVREFPVVPR